MKNLPAQPALYQINTRVWLTELSSRGLYLDAPPWQASVFALTRKS
jgi:hypothetical protein